MLLFGPQRMVMIGAGVSFALAVAAGFLINPGDASFGGPRQEFRPFNWANRTVAAPAEFYGWTPPRGSLVRSASGFHGQRHPAVS